MSASQYEFDSMVQGFHEYQWIWAPVVCKEFPCKHEMHNWYDSFVVVVTKVYISEQRHRERGFEGFGRTPFKPGFNYS